MHLPLTLLYESLAHRNQSKTTYTHVSGFLSVWGCVCARARARARVYECVCVCVCLSVHTFQVGV
jgi:hypothetical protein